MKIQLGQDALFEKKETITNQLKLRQRQKMKRARSSRVDLSTDIPQLDIQVIDPLPGELKKYKNQIQYKNTYDLSKASQVLKKYVIQQQRNLKRIRLEKLQDNNHSTTKRGSIKIKIKCQPQKQKSNEQINIPKIQEEFKNQQKQFVLFESRLMRQRLKKASHVIDNGVNKIKSLTFTGVKSGSVVETRKNSTLQKYETIINPENKDYKQTRSDAYGHGNKISYQNDLQDYELDAIIEKKLKKSQILREKLYSQKKQMATMQAKQSTTKSLNFYIPPPKKPKKKVFLQGVKPIIHKKGNQQIKVTPASSLLFSLNQMSKGHMRKQSELSELIQNSYQNRSQTLSQKSDFYQQETSFNDLSPSNQFRLRKLMDKKLLHRIQLSRQQINKFVAYLSQIKNYHVILNEPILNILKQVRQILLTGKVMKTSDLSAIIESVPKNLLNQYPNNLILQKLSQMMI